MAGLRLGASEQKTQRNTDKGGVKLPFQAPRGLGNNPMGPHLFVFGYKARSQLSFLTAHDLSIA